MKIEQLKIRSWRDVRTTLELRQKTHIRNDGKEMDDEGSNW